MLLHSAVFALHRQQSLPFCFVPFFVLSPPPSVSSSKVPTGFMVVVECNVAALASTPADVLRTRLMAQDPRAPGAGVLHTKSIAVERRRYATTFPLSAAALMPLSAASKGAAAGAPARVAAAASAGAAPPPRAGPSGRAA